MSTQQMRSANEIAQKGREVFRRVVEPQLTPEDHGKFVAVAVDHDDFAVGQELIDAAKQIMDRYPGALMHLERVGHSATFKIRGSSLKWIKWERGSGSG